MPSMRVMEELDALSVGIGEILDDLTEVEIEEFIEGLQSLVEDIVDEWG